MKQVIAMHGWGSDSNSWQIWANQFRRNGWQWQSTERGYGELPSFRPYWEKASKKDCYQQRVVIAHSLGLHLLNNEILSNATDIVLMASFSRFIPNGIESRVLKAALKGMQKRLGTTEETTMLNNFLQKACRPEEIREIPPGPITKGLSFEGRKQLQADLELLIRSHKLPRDLQTKSRVLIVQGTEDSIVLPSSRSALLEDLKKHLDGDPTYWEINGAGHLLLDPGLINRVENWLDAYR